MASQLYLQIKSCEFRVICKIGLMSRGTHMEVYRRNVRIYMRARMNVRAAQTTLEKVIRRRISMAHSVKFSR